MVPSICLVSRLLSSTQHHASFYQHIYMVQCENDVLFVQSVNKLKFSFQNLFAFADKIVKAMRHCSCSGFRHLCEALLLEDCLLSSINDHQEFRSK